MPGGTSKVKTTFHKTKNGAPRIKQKFPDGRTTDITSKRVKEWVPQTHPNAPKGTMDKVVFKNAQPGTKGHKRNPTPAEQKMLDEARENK